MFFYLCLIRAMPNSPLLFISSQVLFICLAASPGLGWILLLGIYVQIKKGMDCGCLPNSHDNLY
ncbi:hypothetical protein P167DRAFT_203899 [Morchella conica CCBAS932]|uniref:Uncharacterized protein n=1 Tax=Morchella conica CCBAS932 TaxID=1392247 RepID=A0A3N4L6A4_9PEZI|nr:hypothetical protein P167DRAFT_203899 [Morchella conica CCBAS932]